MNAQPAQKQSKHARSHFVFRCPAAGPLARTTVRTGRSRFV